MAAIGAALTMVNLDTVITNTALPTIARGVGTDPASAVWVVNAYQIAMVALLLPFAAMGEIVGHRRLYITGLAIFVAASLGCGLATSLEALVAARAVQGIGGALVMSVHMALLRYIYPARMLGRGLGTNALIVGIAFTIGPTAASAILSVASWPWLFLVNVPIGLAAFVIAMRTLPATTRSTHRFDGIAAVCCAGGFALLVLGLGTVVHDEPIGLAVAQWIGAAICLAVLMRRQAGHPAPMLAVDLFRRLVFALSAVTAICAFATQGLAFVALPFLLETSYGYDAVATGLLITPWPAMVALMAPVAGRLSDRYSPGLLGGAGLLVLAIGFLSLATLPAHPSSVDIVWRAMVCGAGFGFFQSPNLRALMTSAPPERSGGASGIVAAARLLGQTLGAALVALCFHASGATGPKLALWLGFSFALAGSIASGLRIVAARRNAQAG